MILNWVSCLCKAWSTDGKVVLTWDLISREGCVFCRATARLIIGLVYTHIWLCMCTLKFMYTLHTSVGCKYVCIKVDVHTCGCATVRLCTQDASMGSILVCVTITDISLCHLPYCHLVSSYFHDNLWLSHIVTSCHQSSWSQGLGQPG